MKQLIRRLLFPLKYAEPSQDPLGTLLLPSLIGIVLCAVCMAGGTYAWFSVSTTMPAQTIQSANYSMEQITLDGVPLISNPETSCESGRTFFRQ